LPQQRPAKKARQDVSGASPRILIVEDDYIVSVEIENALLAAGFDVVGVVGAADEAVEHARVSRPTLVVMDVRLRGANDGVDAALEIYRETGARCIFATAHQDRVVRNRARPAAPLGWLAKPYETSALVALIRKVLAAD
jgi:DNA-binding NarL/FixJ family response regulator